MGNLAKRAIALPVAALSAVALTGIVAGTANAAAVTGGSVTLNVNDSFLAALAKHGVIVAPHQAASVTHANGQVSVTFAATGGDANVSTFSGTISTSGSLCIRDVKTGKGANLSALLFDLTDAQWDGQPSAAVGEEPLVDLAGTQSTTINGTTQTYVASDLTLDAAGATYLDSALHTSAFVSGTDIGSFSATWVYA
jgi:hypothetical protein